MTEKEVNILAVDDEPRNLRALEALLAGVDATLFTADSGKQALVHAAEREFALILMDVQMPVMDGVEAAGLIRQRGRSRAAPIIFLTAYDRAQEQVLRGYAIGAVDFLFKPVVPEILKSKVAVFIDLYKKALAIERQQAALREAERRALERDVADERARWEELRLREELENEHRLFVERERQVVTLRSIADATLATDPAGHITLLNTSGELLTGWTERDAIGVPVDDVVRLFDAATRQPRSLASIARSCDEVAPLSDSILVRRDGTERVVTDHAAPVRDYTGEHIGAVMVLRDVTLQRQMEHDLQNAQRMETVGLLAGGIAHDFNNTLAMIMASSTLARMNLATGSQAERLLGEIEEACGRATALTRQLLTFAKGGAPVRERCAVDRLVRDSVGFSLRGSTTNCTYDMDSRLWAADVDPGQVSQLLGNLVLNARHAMNDAGSLHVHARNYLVDGTHAGPLAAGRYVEIAVSDTGTGIPEEHLGRVFDPYFTTKPDGTGLGLSSAYSIARRHGGLLRVESQEGDGATFLVYLPVSEEDDSGAHEPAPESRPHDGDVRVLLMDDEKSLRTIVAECLLEMGHRVSSASDGRDAVEQYRHAKESGDAFDLVILDLTVRGGVGGVEALARLKQLDPHVRAVASSGYADDPVMANYREHGFAAVLPKPFRFAALARAVRQALSTTGPAQSGTHALQGVREQNQG